MVVYMKKNTKKTKSIKLLFLIISLFYFLFLFIDIFKIESFISSNTLKFLSMILVFIISAITGKDALSKKNHSLLNLGLFITIFADVFLLLLHKYYILGVGLFSIVQILYSVRYSGNSSKIIFPKFISLFVILLFIYFIMDNFIVKVDFLTVISLFYAICILSSTYMAIRVYRHKLWPELNSEIIFIAMILFLFCDINVALYNVLDPMSISNNFIVLLRDISFVAMWLFYLPSQVLLALSGYKESYLKDLFKI